MERALAVENLVAICRRVFAGYWGPRTDDLMRAACLTLTAQPGPRTLADLPDLLTNPDVRARALRALHDPVLRGFWAGYNRLSEPARAVVIAPLMNRIRALLLRPYARALLTGQAPGTHTTALTPATPGRPPIDVARVLDGGLLLARLPKGSLGDDATRLLGSIIVAHTWTAATARTHQPQEARRDAGVGDRRMPQLPQPALQHRRPPRRSPRPTPIPHLGAPEPRPTPHRSCGRGSPPTPATKSSSPSAPTTPATSPATPPHTWTTTTWPTSTPSTPPPAWSTTTRSPPPSPCAPDPSHRPCAADRPSARPRATAPRTGSTPERHKESTAMPDPHPASRPDTGRSRGSPRPQRAHRDPFATGRSARFSDRHLAALATRLTPRDLWLLAMLYEHRVLTTHAIAHMAFSSDHRARRRLLQLHRWDVVERFAPRLPVGAAPMHYVLGPAGAAVLAAHHGLPVRALGYRRDHALAIAHHHTLAHTIAVNDLFAHLIHHTHTGDGSVASIGSGAGRGGVRLDCWWSEARCRRHLDYVRPDAYARLTTPTHPGGGSRTLVFEWFLELDFATSTLDILAAKLDRYAQLAATTRPRPILIWLPTPAREAHARQRLATAQRAHAPGLVPVATSTAPVATLPRPDTAHAAGGVDGEHDAAQPGPADAVWLPLDRRHTRGWVDLADLARLWPAPPGHTLADEADATIGGDTDVDAETVVGGLPAPHPLPPRSLAGPVRAPR